MYIKSAHGVSPQPLYDDGALLPVITTKTGNRLVCVEPNYADFIDAKLIRRMSRIIKMGVAAAMQCLKDADLQMPDAIVTGTAYGCLQDTEVFLNRLVEFKEELLTPTAFIQSTHNTVSAQIALMLQCHNYNNTYVHRGFSFESALLDTVMMLNDKEINNALVGAADEIIDTSHAILSRFGLYKKEAFTNTLFDKATKGTIAGEGATFFTLSKESSGNDLAKLDAVTTFYKPADDSEIKEQIAAFLAGQILDIEEIDLIITGKNGDVENDAVYESLNTSLFANKQTINFKHLCGEYPTASAYALWLGSAIIKEGKVPASLLQQNDKPVKRVLIYNHYLNMHHALYLLSAC
ncbi:beta-ketoacyl synthase [Panacibacter ginsenosidivorans]|uniref:Beta-ketoacyl synthase n=1 Tax=Panacibacter ginsenosidivorans TaxID=1813871 RepID=A0A5B8VGA0_9BACT|nr:beta-ketoacyl synthase [Panacibacter ginsenosidivorans]